MRYQHSCAGREQFRVSGLVTSLSSFGKIVEECFELPLPRILSKARCKQGSGQQEQQWEIEFHCSLHWLPG